MLSEPLTASYLPYVPDFPEQRRSAAQQAGINYEKQVIKKFTKLYAKIEVGPWLLYSSPKRHGICQPDALIWLSPTHLLVVEIKLSRLTEARRKLTTFYGPILQKIYPAVKLSYLQVYKNWRKGAHKKPLSIYSLDDIKQGVYKECQFLGL